MPRIYNVHDCEVCDRRKIISLKENRKTYVANNILEKKVAQYHLDTETRPPKKCDYALYIFDNEIPENDDNRVVFIELKCSNVRDAIDQICQSIIYFIINPRIECNQIDARIVSSRVPNPNFYSTQEVKLKKLLRRFGCGSLEIGSNGYFEENI